MAEREFQLEIDMAVIVARLAFWGCDTFFVVIHGESHEFEVQVDVLVAVTKVLAHETHIFEV